MLENLFSKKCHQLQFKDKTQWDRGLRGPFHWQILTSFQLDIFVNSYALAFTVNSV